MIITIPSLVLFCDHFMAHIIKYKDMVKVEKISPQQVQSKLQLVKCHSNDDNIKGKKLSTSSKWHIIMIKHLPYLCNLALVLTLYLALVILALILQIAAIGFGDSLPTAALPGEGRVNMFIYSCLLNDKFVIPCLLHAILKISMVGCRIT